jgi:hypothetical protein
VSIRFALNILILILITREFISLPLTRSYFCPHYKSKTPHPSVASSFPRPYRLQNDKEMVEKTTYFFKMIHTCCYLLGGDSTHMILPGYGGGAVEFFLGQLLPNINYSPRKGNLAH